jgi:hypothetical protein
MPQSPPALPGDPGRDPLDHVLPDIQYPLTLSFKIIALASQATVTDANGRVVCYTRQKLLKFREHVEVWTDKNRSSRLADIKANRMIDWSARYHSTDASGTPIGSVGRRGWRSIWKANYQVFNPGDDLPDFSIHEENPWSKVADSVLGGIPILGMLTGFFFHPRYIATRSDSTPAMRMAKESAFFEGRFRIEKVGNLTKREQLNLLLSFMMLVMLERQRG